MWDWFAKLVDTFVSSSSAWWDSVTSGSYYVSPVDFPRTAAFVFALGDLLISTFFQLAFGRYGMKLSSRQLWTRPKEKGE